MKGLWGWSKHAANRRAFSAWWLGRGLLALFVVSPLAAQLNRATARFPEGDAVLFEPGGILLVETLRLRSAALGATLSSTWLLVGVAVLISWLLSCGLLSAMGGPGDRRLVRWLLSSMRGLPAHGVLTLGAWAARAMLLLLGVLLTVSLHHVLGNALNERTHHALLAGAALLASIPLLWVQVWLDLARGGLRRRPRGARRSALLSLELFARRPIRCLALYLLLTMTAYAGMGLAALIARQLPWPLLAALVQQLGFFWLCAWRASWLWRCTQLAQAAERRLP